jgi:transposase
VTLEATDVTHDEFVMNGVSVQMKLAKSVFQIHGGQAVIRRQLKRRSVLVFFQKRPSSLRLAARTSGARSSHRW